MKINIYTAFNGVGLERDFLILKSLISPKHVVNGLDFLKRQIGNHADLNIHLEIPRYNCVPLAPKNILIPNPEWFYPNWLANLPRFDEVWCKTQDSLRIFSSIHRKTVLSGFYSEDFFSPCVKQKKLVHIAGKSLTKGTRQIQEAYRTRPSLPPCLIVSSTAWAPYGNLKRIDRLDLAALKRLMNESLIHLCPSSYEGWGHYLHEAFSTGSAVITTNHAPMNEFSHDFLVSVHEEKDMGIAKIGVPEVKSIADRIEEVYNMGVESIKRAGDKNREDFLSRNQKFKDFLKEKGLC